MACRVGCAVVVLATIGCGDRMARVSGLVTLDGEPVRGGGDVRATVFFNPVGGGPAGVGLVESDGAYRLATGGKDGVVPGEYNVTFTATEIIRPEGEGGTPIGKRISPPRYATPSSSGLNYTVEAGGNTIDLDLTTNES